MEATLARTAPLCKFAEDFHESGYGVIRQAIPSELAVDLRNRLLPMLPASDGTTPLQQLVPRIVERGPIFADLVARPELVATLTEIFGGVVPHLVCSYGHAKPAQTRAHTGTHSDVAHLTGVPHHQSLLMVKAMFALNPVTEESSATMLIPGSHRAPDGGSGRPAQRIRLNPGDLMLFQANIRHSATDNAAATPRLTIWLVYAQPWMRVFPGYEYNAPFLAAVREQLATQPYLSALYGLDDPYATRA
jgi:hypothetical protein